MSNLKRGDVVVLVIGGKVFNALVHQVCVTEPSHVGENGEPTLHLSYVPDDTIVNGKPKVWPIGHIPESAMLYSVVHASHKFSPEYMRSHGLKEVREHDVHRVSAEAEIRNRRGAGEWRETEVESLRKENAELTAALRGRGRGLTWSAEGVDPVPMPPPVSLGEMNQALAIAPLCSECGLPEPAVIHHGGSGITDVDGGTLPHPFVAPKPEPKE